MSTVIIDTGSLNTRAGLNTWEYPMAFPTAWGKTKQSKIKIGESTYSFLGGEQAIEKRRFLDMHYPIEAGVINNFDDLNTFWEYIIGSRLNIDPSEHNFLLSETSLNPKENREKIIETMFEKYEVGGFFMMTDAVMSLAATGKITGVVCEVGDQVTSCVPVYNYVPISGAITRSNIAGKELVRYMTRILSDRGYSITTPQERDAIRFFIENSCYVPEDYEKQVINFKNKTCMDINYEMPDGTVINMGIDRIACPEVLFNPAKNYQSAPGVHENLFKTIDNCPEEIQEQLYSNIVVSGGTSILRGFQERIEAEMEKFCPEDLKNSVKASGIPDRFNGTWLGGKALCADNCIEFITKEVYQEEGVGIVHKKCTF